MYYLLDYTVYLCSTMGWGTYSNTFLPDIDYCASGPCVHGSCYEEDNSPVCVCTFQYEGVFCEAGNYKQTQYWVLYTIS